MSEPQTDRPDMITCPIDGDIFPDIEEWIAEHNRTLLHQQTIMNRILAEGFAELGAAITAAFLPAIEKINRAIKKLAKALRGPKPHNRRKKKKLVKKLWGPKNNKLCHILPKVPVKR